MKEHPDLAGADHITSQRSLSARVFISPGDNRLRTGWRLLLFALLVLAGFLALLLVISLAAPLLPVALFTSEYQVGIVLQAILVTLVVVFARLFIDQRSFTSLGVRIDHRTLPNLLFGFLLGGVLVGGIFAIFYSLGWLHIVRFAWQDLSLARMLAGSLVLLFSVGLLVGWHEELLFRGYLLQNLRDGMRLPAAWLLSSLLFGCFHLSNPHADWHALVGITLSGGMLAFAWISSGQLWLPIGLHAGWNVFQALLGLPVSGIDLFHLLHLDISGPTLITGGGFGPEAGLINLPVVLVGIGCIHLWSRRVKQIPA